MSHTALIAGATGLVGGYCLKALLAHPAYTRVHALVRRPLGETHPRLVPVVADFDRLEDLPSAEHVFCALGTTIRKAGSREAFRKVDLEYPRRIAERAAASGARRFVLVSSVGAEARSPNFYLRVKAELESAVLAMPFEAVHIFRPSFLVGDRAERRTGEAIGIAISRVVQFALVGALRKYRPMPAETLAGAMLASALSGPPGPRIYHFDEIVALAGGGY